MRTTSPGQSPLLLLDVVAILDRAGVDYAVIGAMAAAFHGAVRASLDADALIFPEGKSIDSLASAFRDAGFKTEVRTGDIDDPVPGLIALEDGHGNRVDLLTGLRGLDPGTCSRAVQSEFEGERIRFAGVEDLVAMKLFAGGPQDLEDARQILAVGRASVDVPLVRELARRFGREASTNLERLLRDDQVRGQDGDR